MITLAIFGALATQAAMPFALVSDPVVAGIFSLVNTTLNAVVIFMVNRAVKMADANTQRLRGIHDTARDSATVIREITGTERRTTKREDET